VQDLLVDSSAVFSNENVADERILRGSVREVGEFEVPAIRLG